MTTPCRLGNGERWWAKPHSLLTYVGAASMYPPPAPSISTDPIFSLCLSPSLPLHWFYIRTPYGLSSWGWYLPGEILLVPHRTPWRCYVNYPLIVRGTLYLRFHVECYGIGLSRSWYQPLPNQYCYNPPNQTPTVGRRNQLNFIWLCCHSFINFISWGHWYRSTHLFLYPIN